MRRVSRFFSIFFFFKKKTTKICYAFFFQKKKKKYTQSFDTFLLFKTYILLNIFLKIILANVEKVGFGFWE